MQVKVFERQSLHKKALFILFNDITYFFIYVFKSGIFLFFFPCFFRASIKKCALAMRFLMLLSADATSYTRF